MLDVYAEVLKEHQFQNISDVDFSYFDQAKQFNNQKVTGVGFKRSGIEDNVSIPAIENIRIHFSNNHPQGYNKLHKTKEYMKDKLSFTQIAWDGGSWPGNEYYRGNFNGSGDPAAACNSLFPELHSSINPNINGKYLLICQNDGSLESYSSSSNNIDNRSFPKEFGARSRPYRSQ